MIFLKLFWAFFRIGLFTIGGGYAMVPMIEDVVIDDYCWLTHERLLDFMGVAESTPGPLAINLATFIGSAQGGVYGAWGSVLGAICATLGVVAPSFIIILIIALLVEKFTEAPAVQGFFYGVRPVVAGLVAASAVSLGLGVILPLLNLTYFKSLSAEKFDWVSLVIMAIIFVLGGLRLGKAKKKIHPALLVILAAGLGVLLFGALKL
ncbi:MAG: chromate transporter [Clostridia bacterium]|nr:chromate transporter [Clostridia bacterium]